MTNTLYYDGDSNPPEYKKETKKENHCFGHDYIPKMGQPLEFVTFFHFKKIKIEKSDVVSSQDERGTAEGDGNRREGRVRTRRGQSRWTRIIGDGQRIVANEDDG